MFVRFVKTVPCPCAGAPYYDETPLWPAVKRGNFSWRIRFVTLGELRAPVITRRVLDPLRPGAPAHWFNGFIQKSHALTPADFEALRVAFEQGLRAQQSGETPYLS